MNSVEALDRFLRCVLEPGRAEQYCDLIQRPKGQKKILHDLYHTIRDCFRTELVDTELNRGLLSTPGFSYSECRGFGVEESSIEDGFDALMPDTGWLLIDANGKFGIYQPEDMIDDRRQIVA